jgi:hypothetical protein
MQKKKFEIIACQDIFSFHNYLTNGKDSNYFGAA